MRRVEGIFALIPLIPVLPSMVLRIVLNLKEGTYHCYYLHFRHTRICHHDFEFSCTLLPVEYSKEANRRLLIRRRTRLSIGNPEKVALGLDREDRAEEDENLV